MADFEEALKKLFDSKKVRKGEDKVSAKYVRAIVQSLQWVSLADSSALYLAGKKFGKEVAGKSFKSSSLKELVKEMGKLFDDYGIGKLGVKEMADKSISIVLKDSASSSGMVPVGRPVCFFEAGLMAGIMEERLRKEVTVTEVLCGGLGDDTDEFLAKIK